MTPFEVVGLLYLVAGICWWGYCLADSRIEFCLGDFIYHIAFWWLDLACWIEAKLIKIRS